MDTDLTPMVSALERSVHACVLADRGDIITYVNPAFVRMWGYHNRDQILGRSLAVFWKDPEAVHEVVDALPARRQWEGGLDALHNDGSTFAVYAVMAWVQNPPDRAFGTMSCFLRTTEPTASETELRQVREMMFSGAA